MKNKGIYMKNILFFGLLIFLLAGCDRLTSDIPDIPERREPRVRGILLARVNDWAIGREDFNNQIEAVRTLAPEAELDSPEARRRFLEEIVNLEILAQKAERKGLSEDREIEEAVRNFKRNLLAQKLLAEIAGDVVVTETEIENFYENNKMRLREPEERRIREIVVPTRAEARDVLVRLLQGESFSVLARRYSIAESKNEGGDLGYIFPDPEDRFQRFWEVAFTTDKGETSNYFRGPEGNYYILQVEDVRGGRVASLHEVRDDIRELLRGRKIENRREDIIYNAKQEFIIEINEGLLE